MSVLSCVIIGVSCSGGAGLARTLGSSPGRINPDETPEQAMFRELEEEVGLRPHQVELLGVTDDWLHYQLPQRFVRRHCEPLCIGQKQRWFLLKVLCEETDFCLDHSAKPEFDGWRW